jgi:6-methylsalicylate decarboxylase
MTHGLVDVQHHAIPPVYRAALEAMDIDSPVVGQSFPAWSPELSLGAMERVGIEMAVLSVSVPGAVGRDAAAVVGLAREVNESFATVIAEHPDRFGAFALLPLPHVDAAIREAEYALDVLRLDGIGLYSSVRDVYLGDPVLEPLMAFLAERAVPVFVHPNVPPHSAPSFGLPASVLEFPLETTRAVTNLLFSGTLDRHPELRLILAHAGGAVPYLAQRLTYGPTIAPHLRGQPPRDAIASLRRLYYDLGMSATPQQLRCLLELVDASHVLFATDFPFMPIEHALDNAAAFRNDPQLSEAQIDQIGRGTAASLFPRIAAAV